MYKSRFSFVKGCSAHRFRRRGYNPIIQPSNYHSLLMTKNVIVVMALVIGIATIIVSGYSLFVTAHSNAKQSSVSCPFAAHLTLPAGPEPYAGWSYFLVYNITNRLPEYSIGMPSCQFIQNLQNVGVSGDNISAVASQVLGLRPGNSYVDITNDTWLWKMTGNGYVHAFYVDSVTRQVELKQGVTYEGGVFYYQGVMMTNETQVP